MSEPISVVASAPVPAPAASPAPVTSGVKLRGAEKMARIPIKIEATTEPLRKPSWIRAKTQGTPEVARIKAALRANNLHTVCEEAACPNLGECFGKGTATFMIMGDICTRRCPFCDVAHGRPKPLDTDEPTKLARTIRDMGLRYVVITSVDRDDLRDGGAAHWAATIRAVKTAAPELVLEVLTGDFKGDTGAVDTVLAAGRAEAARSAVRCRAFDERSDRAHLADVLRWQDHDGSPNGWNRCLPYQSTQEPHSSGKMPLGSGILSRFLSL